jgi:sterol desaturase/sphingolipid hydroxylase (fatty acid hydroxylase superfamily)
MLAGQLKELQMVLFIVTPLALLTLEYFIPARRTLGKVKHDSRNMLMWLLTLGIMVAYGPLLVWATEGAASVFGFGFPLLKIAIVLLLLDLFTYVWHFGLHNISFLWVFHRVHHSDSQMNVTTSLRIHPLEVVLWRGLFVLYVWIMGATAIEVILYEGLLLVTSMFHHSNIGITSTFDSVYRTIFASPHMHWLHHSSDPEERDTNYGAVFSIWDRVFGTYVMKGTLAPLGDRRLRADKWNTLKGMIKTPFAKR